MKVTFNLSNLTEHFYDEFASLSNPEKFQQLSKLRKDLPRCIHMKIGNGSMRDTVELNALMKKFDSTFSFKIEPRKGYKLATFIIE